MSHGPADPRWPKLLSLAVHEFRTPITVVAGYIRMLLKDRAGPITDQQRRLLEEAEKSCGRLSALVAEMSDLSGLEGGTAALKRAPVDLTSVLQEAIASLPPMPDREVTTDIVASDPAEIDGDPTRLRTALASIVAALRREVVTSDRLLISVTRHKEAVVMILGDPEQMDAYTSADPETLEPFDEWRGGSGLSLAIARRIIAQHGGRLLAPPGEAKAGGVIVLPVIS